MKKSSSSISSFEFNSLEIVSVQACPRATIGLLLVVAVVEFLFWGGRVWFADQAAWYWQSKTSLIENGQLRGDVAILGTSVSLHGIDPALVNIRTRSDVVVVNLALNGMKTQQQNQLLRRSLASGEAPQWVILELHRAVVDRESWISGPYWRFWATWSEFCESYFYYWDPARGYEFWSQRLLASYAYRRAIGNWLVNCVHRSGLEVDYRSRNIAIMNEMRTHLGFVEGDFARGLEPSDIPPPQVRHFELNAAGELWIRRILSDCARNGIAVAVLKPPVPRFVDEDRARSGFDAEFDAFLERLSWEFPQTIAGVIEPQDYELSDFADDHHLSYQGMVRLSLDIADWVDSLANQEKRGGDSPESLARGNEDRTWGHHGAAN